MEWTWNRFDRGLLEILLLISSLHVSSSSTMSCKYGERGALTAICTNAVPNYFRDTNYRFDHLDETLLCVDCILTDLSSGSFDISGNQLRILDIRNSSIEFVREKSFTGLVFLEKLLMSNNQIKELEPGAFFGARKIKQIYLENALTAPLHNFAFRELRELRELHLKNNSLNRLESHTFYGLDNLELLDLSYNKLKVINNTLTLLKNLKVVFLNNNDIIKVENQDFQGLDNLLKINLAINYIGSLSFNLSESNKLRELDLSNNHLGNQVVRVGLFKDMHNLEVLNMALNWFKTIPPKLFQGLYNLRELNLSNNNISLFKSGAFSGLPSLRVINVSHNNIDNAEITGKLSLHQLHVIDLSDNKISQFDFLKFIERAPRISVVDLRSNLMPCSTRRREEEYFKDESIKLRMDLENCPLLSSEEIKQIRESLTEEIVELESGSSTLLAFKIILLVLVILSVILMFYTQFFIINRRNI